MGNDDTAGRGRSDLAGAGDGADDEAFYHREVQLREAQRIAGVGSWQWQIGSEEVIWSEGLHLILRRDLERGAPPFSELQRFYLPESWERLGVAIQNTIARGEPYELELAMLRDDGSVCWTTTRGEAMRGPDGNVSAMRGTVHDITERRAAEKAYQEREAQLREAQRIAGIGSWEWDVGGEDVIWSEGLQLILGRDPGLGAPPFSKLSESYTTQSWERLGVAIQQTIADGTPYELELEMVRADGETCWTSTRGEAVRAPDGSVASLRGTVLDITERKRLQAQTAQAERLSSMGLLAAGVAHEVNNPLTYVLYNVETLAEDLPKILEGSRRASAALREHLGAEGFAAAVGDSECLQPSLFEDAIDRAREALDGAQRIKVLIRSLSTFSRVEKVEETRVDLKQAIESAVNMAQNEMRFRARLVQDLGRVPPVWASEGKLSQVFLNLLINAAHAIDEGHVDDNVIKIRTWSDGDNVFAEVADSGKGIAPTELERVFEPFFSTKQIGRGSGLGLAICKNLVTAFGGDITVRSELDAGTRFTVRLPAARDPVESAQDARTSERTVDGRVLVIDDEPSLRKMLQRMLPRYEVITASTGLEGRAILQEDQAFDVILCDLMMPEMTGMELHEWLADHHSGLAERVVFITGGAFTPRAAEYLTSVKNRRLQKPFNRGELQELVAEYVAGATDEPPPGG